MKQRKPSIKKLMHQVMDTVLEHYDEHIPEKGVCRGLSVSFRWPDTDYQGILRVEQDLRRGSEGRCLRTMMHEYGSDRVVSHYILWGDNDCLKSWLAQREHYAELQESYEQLKQSVDNFD